ncbi:hypothetical protein [Rhodoferax sp.]|uniref:hypothetical protein n=1 Tax=Rhodoferax sp. TaxID=50421 RepID=UPI00276099B5|nr:hypothetical protein [Rhodoferax sp.]
MSLFSFVLRVLLLVAGLVFALSLAVAAVLVLLLWGLRALWAKLTGQTVSPFVMRIDPRSGFGRVCRSGAAATPPPAPATGSATLHDVTDVEPKPPRT